jgi:hypothetical protein
MRWCKRKKRSKNNKILQDERAAERLWGRSFKDKFTES